jgi:uncharacterized protein YndB with AHSA1/START domain
MTEVEQLRIDRTIDIQASPERVWRALTDAAELAAWFQVRIEGKISAGADIWMTSEHPEHAGMRWSVRIVELTRPRRVVWSWHPGAVDPAIDYSMEPPTTVTFTLEASGPGTRVTVSETGFELLPLARRAKAYADNVEGWTEVIVWLQRHVEAAR